MSAKEIGEVRRSSFRVNRCAHHFGFVRALDPAAPPFAPPRQRAELPRLLHRAESNEHVGRQCQRQRRVDIYPVQGAECERLLRASSAGEGSW